MNFKAMRVDGHSCLTRKILKVMKITTFFMLISILTVSAASYAQKITLNERRASLEQLLDKVRQQSGYNIVYSDELLSKSHTVTLNLKDASLEDALKAILVDQTLTYEIENKTIIIKEREVSLLDKAKFFFAQVTVSGKVQDEIGQPLVGVTVKLKGTNQATATDANGVFTITVPDDKIIIVFSFIGYETVELAAREIANGSIVSLKTSTTKLQEVMVNKGYYTEKQELSTGNVGILTSKEIEQQPVSDPIQALEGRVPGLSISQSSGVPGAGMNIRIRGQNSITQGNDPLYIVDGVPFVTNSALSNTLSIYTAANVGLSAFNTINPGDIDNIEVLKDADATAIYGSRGANGVILITTKKGKIGSTKVTANIKTGYGQVTRMSNFLNTQQYLQMRREAFRNDALSPTSSQYLSAYDINGTWDTTRYTDWQKLLIGNKSHYTDVNTSLSGGNINTQFYIGASFNSQSTVFPGDFEDKRGSVHFNLNHQSSNKKFKANLSAFYTEDNNQLPASDLTGYITLPPDAPSIYNADGKLNWQNSTWTNPYSYLLQKSNNIVDNLNADLNLNYELTAGLNLQGNFGFNNIAVSNLRTIPQSSLDPAKIGLLPSATYGNSAVKSWIIEPQLNYQKDFGRNHVEVLVGATFSSQVQNTLIQQGTGYTNDAQLENIQAAQTLKVTNAGYSQYRYASVLGRLNYNWAERYLFNLTARRDGSTRFGPGKQYANFGSIGAGWIFSKEALIQQNLSFLSFGKLRGSYGITGNDQIGDYQFLNTYTTGSQTYQGIVPLSPARLNNSDYAWEINKKLELSLDLGFFNDKITLSGSYYINKASNQLIQYTEPAITGFVSVIQNFPAIVQNTGIELTLNTTNIKSKDFYWTSSANLTIPKNKLLDFPNITTSSYATSYIVGQPLNIIPVYTFTGLNPQTGLYTFLDYNNDGKVSAPADRQNFVFIGQDFYGGIQNTLQYKRWRLDFFIQFVKQPNKTNGFYSSLPGSMNNQFGFVMNRWQSPGQLTTVQQLSNSNSATSQAYSTYTQSNAIYVDGSYIRMKNVSLSYSFPEKWNRVMHTGNTKLFIQGQNLLTITKYPGLDPETGGLLPVLKVLTAGVQIDL
jgi:TonB-linked SusC/RagA family outer membrane protein